MSDLAQQIADLQEQFQRLAERNDWLTLRVPPRQDGPLFFGESFRPSDLLSAQYGDGLPGRLSRARIIEAQRLLNKRLGSKRPPCILDPADPQRSLWQAPVELVVTKDRQVSVFMLPLEDSHTRLHECLKGKTAVFGPMRDGERRVPANDVFGPPPWVLAPADLHFGPVVEHARVLTQKANLLLLSVLDEHPPAFADITVQHGILPGIEREIRELNKTGPNLALGWAYWLRRVAPEWLYTYPNYGQIAATALSQLEVCRRAGEGGGPPSKGPPVVLRGSNEKPLVNDKEKPLLTPARYDVIKMLVDAYPGRVKKDTLERDHSGARQILNNLASDPDWAAVLDFPGKTGRGWGLK